ncbi:MAG TPA: hypothetical protein VLM76_02145 [Patescibacteria group bacterium]|nr:hypothetical protein [Patescibacteria group bacterium]
MTAIPATFRAFVAVAEGDGVTRSVRTFDEAELPPGEVEVRVGWSSVTTRTAWRPSRTARSPGSAPSSPESTWPAR